jgi:predicted nucleic acid-binding protein
MAALPDRAIRVRITGALKVCRDPNDDMFLECAAVANADLLVAGDKDLLILGSYLGTRTVTPAEYVDPPPALPA